MHISEIIQELRTEKNISRKKLAEILSVDLKSISNWERAITEPKAGHIIKMAELFEVTSDYLLGREK